MTRWDTTFGALLLSIASAACGDVASSEEIPTDTEETASALAHVLLDSAASAAGWRVRVSGFCLPQSSVLPVEVPEEEWAVLERVDGPLYDHQYLYPPAGALLWVRGVDARIDGVMGAELDRVQVTARDEASLREVAQQLDVELAPTDQGWELRAPDVWSALGGVGGGFDDLRFEVRPRLGRVTRAPAEHSSPRETRWLGD